MAHVCILAVLDYKKPIIIAIVVIAIVIAIVIVIVIVIVILSIANTVSGRTSRCPLYRSFPKFDRKIEIL